MTYRMILNETSYFGAGSIAAITGEITKRGFSKALLVTDKDLVRAGVAAKVTDLLDSAGLAYEIYAEVVPNPTVQTVLSGVAAFQRAGADYLIAVGGGSPQDTGKAIGIIIANPEFADVKSLEGVAPTARPGIPLIAIPTTAGTAAEVTINYVITDEENKRKFVCVDPHAIPIMAIIDPELMASMPKSLKAATGVDALTHAMEGYITLGAWELTDALHLKAIEIICRALRDSVSGDPRAVEDMALGQYIAGMGFSNVGLGLVHGMAHPLGAFYNTPHGIANAVLLPHIMAYNAPSTGEKFRHIATAMGIANSATLTLDEVRAAVVEALRRLNQDIGIPEKLRDIGLRREDIPLLAKAALADVCTGGNPRPASEADIQRLYQEIY